MIFKAGYVYGGTYSIGSDSRLYRVVYRPCGILIQKDNTFRLLVAGQIHSDFALKKIISEIHKGSKITVNLKSVGLLEDIVLGRCKDADTSLIPEEK